MVVRSNIANVFREPAHAGTALARVAKLVVGLLTDPVVEARRVARHATTPARAEVRTSGIVLVEAEVLLLHPLQSVVVTPRVILESKAKVEAEVFPPQLHLRQEKEIKDLDLLRLDLPRLSMAFRSLLVVFPLECHLLVLQKHQKWSPLRSQLHVSRNLKSGHDPGLGLLTHMPILVLIFERRRH